jgi:hypothetical protein
MLNIPVHKGNVNQNHIKILPPVRMAVIKKTNSKKCWQRCGEKGTLKQCWRKCKLVQPLWKTVWRLLKKLKLNLPYDPAIILVGIYLKKGKSGVNQGTCTFMFIAALVTITEL